MSLLEGLRFVLAFLVPAQFAKQRLLRLGPALLICGSFTLAVMCLLSPHPKLPSLDEVTGYVSTILVLPLSFQDGIDESLWSLKYEIRFYAVILVLMSFLDLRRRSVQVALALMALDVVIAVVGTLHPAALKSVFIVNAIRKFSGSYFAYFAIGILLYADRFSKSSRWALMSALLLGILLGGRKAFEEIARVSHILHLHSSVNYSVGLVIALCCALVVIWAARAIEVPALVSVLSKLGSMSYPLYLLHQNAGYIILHACKVHLPFIDDPRPYVMTGMVALSYVVATQMEPVVKAYYKQALDAIQHSLQRLHGTLGRRLS